MESNREHPVETQKEQGVALILAMLFSFIASGIIISGHALSEANRKRTDTNFRTEAQATQFARSGLVEGVGWFRRQTSQPVTNFEPVLDTRAVPAVLDTDDPEVGLVREFRIRGNVWGRYEIWKPWPGDPDPARQKFRSSLSVQDVGLRRRSSASGTAWRVRSVGYVFELNDENLSFRETPNRVLATTALEAEIIRRRLAPPGAAAITVGDGNSAHVNTRGRIRGGDGAGLYYPAGTGRPTTGPRREQRVTGNPATAQASSVDMSYEAVFGLSYDELRATADAIVTNSGDIPSPIPTNGLVIIEAASVTFDASLPLLGTGIVIVRGNCSIISGSNSNFNGMLYVDGNLIQRAPSEINGAVVCTGNFNLQGSGDYATINFDQGILDALQQEFGQYKFLGAFRPVFERRVGERNLQSSLQRVRSGGN